jgi:ABC-type antimicrobial peptide transport system permease subunit
VFSDSLNTAMSGVSFMDIETYREIFGYYTARDVVTEIPAAQNALLTEGEDAMFSGGDIYSTGGGGTSVADLEKKIRTTTVVTHTIDLDNAAYNYVTILLKPGQDLGRSIAKMKQIVKDNDLPVKVLSWKTASGQVAQISDILQTIITVFVVLLFIVAIIIIMNTLSMNALERTEEFGMMRAVGAQKTFISKMFLSETFSLSFVFGGAGILLGVLATWIVRPLHISAGSNEILELLFGGEVFQPSLGVAGIIIGIVGLGIVTVLAVLYPVAVARKITPLDAINRH